MGDPLPIRMTKKLRKELCSINDNECIIVEFTNREEDKYAVGFLSWIKKEDSEIDVNSIIEENSDTIIHWPIDIAIQPTKNLIKFLEKAKFSEDVVRLKATGDWVTMKRQLKSLENTGKLDVSKGSRKTLMKKNDSVSQTKSKKVLDLKNAQRASEHQQKMDLLSRLKQRRKQNSGTLDKYDDDLGELDNSSDTDDPRLVAVERPDLSPSPPKRKRKVTKDSPKKSLREDYSSHEESDVEPQEEKSRIDQTSTKKTVKKLIYSGLDENGQNVPPKKKSHPPNQFNDDLSDESGDENLSFANIMRKTQKESENEKSYGQFKGKLNAANRSSAILANQPEAQAKPDLPPGLKRAFPLPESIIKYLTKKKINNYVSALADNLFEKSYLASHSPTGATPNVFKKMNIVPKPPLCPEAVQYIREMVELQFGSQVGIKGKVTKALSDKISTARDGNKSGKSKATAMGAEN